MTSTAIAAKLRMAVSTLSAVLKRLGLDRLWKRGPIERPNSYYRRDAGELVHVDVRTSAGLNVRGIDHSDRDLAQPARAA
jgi:hypothetical protein